MSHEEPQKKIRRKKSAVEPLPIAPPPPPLPEEKVAPEPVEEVPALTPRQLIAEGSLSTPMQDLLSRKQAEGIMQRVEDASNRAPLVEVDPSKPWAVYAMPTSLAADISLVRIGVREEERKDGKHQHLHLVLPDGTDGPTINQDGLRLLGHHAKYRIDFVNRLRPALRAEVINEMLMQHRSQKMQFSGDSGQISNVSPGWRELCSHGEIAQLAYDTLRSFEGVGEVELETYGEARGGFMVRFVTQRHLPVTPKVGDVLAYGIKVFHRYGVSIEVSIFVRRLSCLNGATSNRECFSWISKATGSVQHQLEYLVAAINSTQATFITYVVKAQEMAQTAIVGDPYEALAKRAQALRLPDKYLPEVLRAFEAEPDPTEWGMHNALTRFTTHNKSDMDPDMRERLWDGAGNWVYGFNMVNARLPRPMAEKMGVEILPD